MSERPQWWSYFHPNLTLPLLAIIVYLFLIAAGNLLATYNSAVVEKNIAAAAGNIFSASLFGVPAYGLLKLQRWARLFELVLSIVSVVIGIILMVSGNLGMGVLTIVPHGLIAIYLLSNNCRRAFGLVA